MEIDDSSGEKNPVMFCKGERVSLLRFGKTFSQECCCKAAFSSSDMSNYLSPRVKLPVSLAARLSNLAKTMSVVIEEPIHIIMLRNGLVQVRRKPFRIP